ncbi:hypothetical protein [Paenibacillus contaminans]
MKRGALRRFLHYLTEIAANRSHRLQPRLVAKQVADFNILRPRIVYV